MHALGLLLLLLWEGGCGAATSAVQRSACGRSSQRQAQPCMLGLYYRMLHASWCGAAVAWLVRSRCNVVRAGCSGPFHVLSCGVVVVGQHTKLDCCASAQLLWWMLKMLPCVDAQGDVRLVVSPDCQKMFPAPPKAAGKASLLMAHKMPQLCT